MTPEQIKELQRRLKAKGLYGGEIDGRRGPKTDLAEELEEKLERSLGTDLEREKIELEKMRLQREADAARMAEDARQSKEAKEAKREEDADPFTETFLPFAGGAVAGGTLGEIISRKDIATQRGKANAIKEIGDEIGSANKLTDSRLNRAKARGAAKAAERFAPSGLGRKGLATAGRLGAYGIPAGLAYYEYQRYQEQADNPDLTEADRKVNQAIANGLLGVMTGIGADAGKNVFTSDIPQGTGKAQARIDMAKALAEMSDEPAQGNRGLRAAASPSQFKSGAQARRFLEQSGVKVPQNVRAADLIARADEVAKATQKASAPTMRALASRVKGLGPLAGPIAGGATAGALMLQSDDAEASDGEQIARGAGGAAAGAAVGGGFGAAVKKGYDALSGTGVGRAIGATGRALGAGAIMTLPNELSNATDQTPEQLNMARNKAARYLPEAMHFGAIGTAREMAQVPERNMAMPNRGTFGGGDDAAFDAALIDFLSILDDASAMEAR